MKTVKSCKNTITVCQYHLMEFTSKSSLKNNSISFFKFSSFDGCEAFYGHLNLLKLLSDLNIYVNEYQS